MKKFTGWLIVFLFLSAGCTFNVEVMPSKPLQATSLPAQSFALPTATPEDLIPAEITPTFTSVPPVTEPVFSNVRFGTSPGDASNSTSFPAGTKAVYAVWDYQNMREGLMIKREWYWNGQPWITREEPWDFKKYGASGTIRDISIYDNETGLNSGVYQLRLFIDGFLQPIGTELYTPVMPWVTFYIGSDEKSLTEYMAPDHLSSLEVFDGKRIVLEGINEPSREIYTGREIPYVAWFDDGTHFLFVDRDRSGQIPGTTLGIRDDLWLGDLSSGSIQLLYKSDISFTGLSGPVVSPGGRYIASLEGSGFGDACQVDTHLIFFELASDFKSVRVIRQEEFSGLPDKKDGSVYPAGDGSWQDENNIQVTLDGTCSVDRSQLGDYIFSLFDRTVTRLPTPGSRPPGELGWGTIHGKITDAATGWPIAGVKVTCEHHSYITPGPALCTGSALTDPDGTFKFERVFFRDTDSIQLTVEAAGYQSEAISQVSFTTPEMEANVSLRRLP